MGCRGKAAGRHHGSSPAAVPPAPPGPQGSSLPRRCSPTRSAAGWKRGRTRSVFLSEGRAGLREVKPSRPPWCRGVSGGWQETGRPKAAASGSIHPPSTFLPRRCIAPRNEPIPPTAAWCLPLCPSARLGSNRSVHTGQEMPLNPGGFGRDLKQTYGEAGFMH